MTDRMASESSSHSGPDVFLYTDQQRDSIPRRVKHVRVDPSVTAIPDHAFYNCHKLEEVELPDGLEEIGVCAFSECVSLDNSKFTLPSTLKRIGDEAFAGTPLQALRIPDGIESIGQAAFQYMNFLNFSIPPVITTISAWMLAACGRMFSVEIPENIEKIECGAFRDCGCLRNVAIPPNAEVQDSVFGNTDLQRLFRCESQMVKALKRRFNGLPIHKMLYYQSYHPVTASQLREAIDTRYGQPRTLRARLDPTGRQQDCLGMTPLHILACSTVQEVSLYQVLIEKYPENLVAKDRWGDLPILYAIWGNAPGHIIHFCANNTNLCTLIMS
mmetsp:Transcript_17855/g.37635  ORF Transcript_17855/g.37635 Transcript_17855/m.37635 type:complete len:329 (+) Transcript_17855:84-1070(+)